jgi:hypothetical protein
MTAITYQNQAKSFLTRFGITFKIAIAVPQTSPAWTDDERQHGVKYWVVMTRDEKTLELPFWGSVAQRKEIELAREQGRRSVEWLARPSAYDVLACISADQNCPDTFAEFCSEYGYDSDSRKALATFKRCRKLAKKLQAFFDTDEMRDALAEIQ